MHLTKRSKKIILFILGALALLFVVRKVLLSANFESDKLILLELKSKASVGEVRAVLDQMDSLERLSNPLINGAYQNWKAGMTARFVTQNEVIENKSENKIVAEVSELYRSYWRTELLKKNPKDRTDSTLYNALADYMISNHLTSIPEDSLRKDIKNDVELKRILENQGVKAEFKYRNGFQDLFIWDKETVEHYDVQLPKQSVQTQVVFIEHILLFGYDHYASLGSTQVGGWATKASATLYCNKGQYDVSSEKFNVSYLKHESLHFTDLNDYPNLSAADLEYRSKVIEIMYLTEETMHEKIAEFIYGANKTDRSHSHPYANYVLIDKLSQLIFNTEFNADVEAWKTISVEALNRAAGQLYKASEERLARDTSLAELI